MPSRTHRATKLRSLPVRPEAIDRQRQSYVAMIDRARSFECGQNALLEKTQSLLTRHWARANWRSRAAILKAVNWLLQVAIQHPAQRARGVPLRPRGAKA